MSYDKELEFAKTLALEAGEIMRRYFRSDKLDTSWKADQTPLTVADTTINDLVIEKVKTAFPADGVIGEEASYEPRRPRVWVVDPIDGTIPFSLGIPNSTFSLALVDRQDGQPVVAVTLDPFLELLYSAVKDGGTFLNDEPVKTSQETDFVRNIVSMVGGLKVGEPGYYKPGIASDTIRELGGKYFSLPSHVYFANRVASGELLSAVIGYGSPWDSAAACLLVREAGGIVTDVLGNERRFDEFAAGCVMSANKEIHTKMLDIIETGRH